MTPFPIKQLNSNDFANIIELGNNVHGDGYLDLETIQQMFEKSQKDGSNCSFVMYDGDTLVGFRISYAPGNWELDKYCSPELWPIGKEQMAYFKCNTIHPEYQGKGLGGALLKQSISTLKKMGAKAGLCHIWMQSPGNASYKYFTKAGGVEIKTHPRRWFNDPNHPDYICVLCGKDCYCDACEMMLQF